MNDTNALRTWIVDVDRLPAQFPTNQMDNAFWESLGRTVATFGYLESILGRAVFALTATTPYKNSEIEEAYEKWLPTLERALTGALGSLISDYANAVRQHPNADDTELDILLNELIKASKLRNALCHGTWEPPNSQGASRPFFIDRKLQLFETPIDRKKMDQIRQRVTELSCEVINSVTQLGFQFPGTSGPGTPIY